MKVVRILFSVVILLVVLVVFAVGSLLTLVDLNKMKPVIIETVSKETGIQLAIDGDLSWSFVPSLSIKVKHMRVTLPKETKPFADLYDVKMAAQLSQLWSQKQPLQGDVRIDHLTIMNMQLQDIRINLHFLNDRLRLAPINADLYQGALTGTAEVTQLETNPHWSWDATASNVQLRPLLHDVQNTDAKVTVSGTGSVRFIGQTAGTDKNELLRQLNGQVGVNVVNGALEGIDINYLTQSAAALLSKQPLDMPPVNNQTIFQSLTCSAVIKNGIATTDNLLLSAPSFSTKGAGNIDLPNNNVDMQLTVSSVAITKWSVPVLVTGSLNDPSVRLDALTLKTLVVQEDLEKVKDKVQEQVKQLPKKADKFLKKLLGN